MIGPCWSCRRQAELWRLGYHDSLQIEAAANPEACFGSPRKFNFYYCGPLYSKFYLKIGSAFKAALEGQIYFCYCGPLRFLFFV